jgi:dynein heavy chain 2
VIRAWVENGDPFIIVGNEGCGKNLLIQSAFNTLKAKLKI